MKLIQLSEAPVMVKQGEYPTGLEGRAKQDISYATNNSHQLQEKSRGGNIRFMEGTKDTQIFVFDKEVSIGIMELVISPQVSKHIGVASFQVFNVFILQQYRNKGIGKKLYEYVLHERGDAFASGASMTPASRRVYTSFLGDPTVDVFALKKSFTPHNDRSNFRFGSRFDNTTFERVELNKRTRGLTTGSTEEDNKAIFVMMAT